jgi:hypothetical protein
MHRIEEDMLYTLEVFVESQLEKKEQIGAMLKEVRVRSNGINFDIGKEKVGGLLDLLSSGIQ